MNRKLPHPAKKSKPDLQHQNRLTAFFLPMAALLPLIVFLPSLFHGFLNWDDQLYVLNNPIVQSLTGKTFRAIFSTSFDGHYHPFILLSFAIDHAIAGNSPWFFHLVNILLHTFNTCLVYLLVRKLSSQPVTALLTALIWALHPLMTEAVAWVTARKDVLFGFFLFWSLLQYLNYLEKQKIKYLLISLLLFLCAAFSKEQAAFLAPALFAVDYLKGRKLFSKKVLTEKIPFFIIALIFGLAAIWAQKETGYIKPLSGEAVSFGNRLVLGSLGLVMYLFKWLVPLNLSAYYPYPFDPLKIAPGIYWLSLLILPLLGFLLIFLPKRSRVLTFGLWFFLLNIFVMLRFLQANPGDFYIAERYMYIASFGIAFGFASFITKYISNGARYHKLIIGAVILLIVTSGALTVARVMIWKDSQTLLDNTLKQFPDAYTALNCRGDLYLESGNLPAALKDFDRAVKLNSQNDRAFANRGRARAMSGDLQGALQDLDRAVSLAPKDPVNYVNRGLARSIAGNYEGALQDENTAIRLNPQLADAWLNRANIYAGMGSFPEALADYNRTLQLIPGKAAAYVGRGAVKSVMNDYNGARADFEKAAQLGYRQADLFYQSGLNFYKMQQFPQALKDFTQATNLQPQNAMYWSYKGFAEYNLGKYAEAISSLDVATRLDPGFHLAYAMRGMSYIKSGAVTSGCSDLQLAANLGNQAAAKEHQKYCGN